MVQWVLWSACAGDTPSFMRILLEERDICVAVPDPKGVYECRALLEEYRLWPDREGRLLYGKGGKEVYRLVQSGKARVGLVPLTELPLPEREKKYY